ncbi:MAG: type II toxin-antitoxin system TacA family antitoxin [Chloroflexota bacterium]
MAAKTSRSEDPKRRPSTHPVASRQERFAARLTRTQKETLQRAADISGRSLTEFVLYAAQAAAEDTIRTYQLLDLTARESEAFLAALDNPPPLNPKLRRAMRDSEKTVDVKW